MKKFLWLLIILITITSILCLIKEKKEDKKIVVDNPYKVFTFYKEENLERYKKYKRLDNSFYTHTKEVTFDKLMLVNKYNYVSKDFEVPNLVPVKEFAKEGMYLEKECMEAFVKMAQDALKSNYNIRAISTYRTYNYQENLYQNYVKKDGVKEADTYSARPGFSEHHTGLAIDVDNIKTSYTDFLNTKEFQWMQDNAYKYGFILRYGKDKENITGYMYEPWHYRYVGKDIAKYIYENNITFEEYYYEFIEKN